MNQQFSLKLANDTLLDDANALGVTTEQLQAINITVNAHISKSLKVESSLLKALEHEAEHAVLELTYEIKLPMPALAEQLCWPSWDKELVGFEDYLWQRTCLECFITNDIKSYVEINVSPDGRYAIYHFENYRHPSTLPPQPLFISNSDTKAQIQWTDANAIENKGLTYSRHFSIPLFQLPYHFSVLDNHALIHPCVILYFDEVALYFAANHANPADFHQRRYWSTFILNSIS